MRGSHQTISAMSDERAIALATKYQIERGKNHCLTGTSFTSENI
jgi:hypothetical protein